MAGHGKYGGVDVLSSPAGFHPLSKVNGTQSPARTKGCHIGSSQHSNLLKAGFLGISSNGYGHGHGQSNSCTNLAHCPDDSDDDEFFGAEERSTCSDSDFHDARDADFSSDSESSVYSHTPTRHQGGYRSLLLKLQDEQSKRSALETALQAERQKVRELEQAAQEKGGKEAGKSCSSQSSEEGSFPHHQEGAEAQRDECLDNEETGLAVARMVAEAVGRAAGRADMMRELESQLQKKDQELARLREKLQYWERMNQEMSQQNTHAIEYLRRRRRTWNNVYRTLYFVGAIGLGVGLVAALNLATTPESSESQHIESSK